MGVYAYPDILAWFQEEYAKNVMTKLEMGKGCIRFKNSKHIPYDLIAELCRKISLEDYIKTYEALIKENKRR